MIGMGKQLDCRIVSSTASCTLDRWGSIDQRVRGQKGARVADEGDDLGIPLTVMGCKDDGSPVLAEEALGAQACREALRVRVRV